MAVPHLKSAGALRAEASWDQVTGAPSSRTDSPLIRPKSGGVQEVEEDGVLHHDQRRSQRVRSRGAGLLGFASRQARSPPKRT